MISPSSKNLITHKRERKCDINSLKKLLIIASSLGLVPPSDVKNDSNYKVLTIVLFLFFISSIIYSIVGQVQNTFDFVSHTAFGLQVLSNVLMTLINSESIIRSAFGIREYWRIFLHDVYSDSSLKLGIYDKKSYIFEMELILCHILVCGYIIYDANMWIRSYGTYYHLYVFQRIQYYYIMISAMMVCFFSTVLKYNFKNLNGCIADSCNSFKFITSCDINDASHYYSRLVKRVDLYNEIFGHRIFFIIAISLVGLLEAVNYVLTYVVYPQSNGLDDQFRTEILINAFLEGVLMLVSFSHAL